MNLFEAEQLAKEKIKLHCGDELNFKFNNRKSSLGLYRPYRATIELSRKLVLEGDEVSILDTILHEIAHHLDRKKRGYTNHDWHWKEIAISIGCSGDRCGSIKTTEAKNAELIETAVETKKISDLRFGDVYKDDGEVYTFIQWKRTRFKAKKNNISYVCKRPLDLLVEIVNEDSKVVNIEPQQIESSNEKEKLPRHLVYGDVFYFQGQKYRFEEFKRTRFVAEDYHSGKSYSFKLNPNKPVRLAKPIDWANAS